EPVSKAKSQFSALRGSDFVTSIFTIPLRTRTPTLWPPTRRRSPSAATTSRSFDHARSSGRVAATLLRTPEAARYLGLPCRTLEKHRTYGTGPKYRKIGGRVVYARDDLKVWADLGAKTSTSDPGVATVYPAKRSVTPGRPVAQSHRR